MCGTRGGLHVLPERGKHQTRKRGGAERAEVSRGHSSREVKGRINRCLEDDQEKRKSIECRKHGKRGGNAHRGRVAAGRKSIDGFTRSRGRSSRRS